ncbi:MAG: head-tail connector protein [Burkholderiaceae bacterium]
MITLQEAKTHCRIDGDDSDAELATMIDTASAHISNYLEVEPPYTVATAPAPVKSAALLWVAELYEHREAQSETVLYSNRTFLALLNPYRAMAI